MKKYFLLTALLFVAAGEICAQFSLEKFMAEKLSIFEYKKYSTMTGVDKKTVNEKYENIPVKAEYIILKEGGIMRQSVTCSGSAAQRNKFFDLLFAQLSGKYAKTERDESLGGTRNIVWRAPDNTLFTLSKSPVITTLTMIKMI